MAEPKHRLLYADLFKSTYSSTNNNSKAAVMTESQSSSWSSTTSSQVSSAWDSSSSSSAASDLCCSEADDGDFTAELTRKMAECMLRDDSAPPLKSQACSVDSAVGEQVCEVKNQSPNSSTKRFPKMLNGSNTIERRSQPRSGMRAVFLQSPKTAISGTGVFLPRVNAVPVEFRKKSGCSTVLIPTRVLELLELHHNRRLSSISSSSPHVASPIEFRAKDEQVEEKKEEVEEGKEGLLQLPQEWTY